MPIEDVEIIGIVLVVGSSDSVTLVTDVEVALVSVGDDSVVVVVDLAPVTVVRLTSIGVVDVLTVLGTLIP